MESAVVEPRNLRAANLLGVPGPGLSPLDSDDDEWEEVIGIRPKSSPLPRRKSSTSEDESEEAQREPPLPGTRRVSFADAKGFRLLLVKEFDSRDIPKPPGYDERRQAEGQDVERYSYDLSFPSPLPGPPEELGSRVREQKIELESIELLPGTTVLRGVVRVLNVSFDKTVFVRTTLDAWASHFDLLAEYIQGSSNGVTDCFSFKLTLVPPFDERGARVDFCLRYETPVGTFWANNGAKNYVLFCHQRVKEVERRLQEECVCRKSCLKAPRQHFTTVDNSSLEEKVQSIEKIITGVDALIMESRQVTDSHSATSEEECQKLTMESSQKNASRKTLRRAARQAKLKELFSPIDHKPEWANENEASLLEPPSDSTRQGEHLGKSFLGSPSCSEGSSADVKGNISPAQSRESSKAEKSESVDAVQPLSAERREVRAAHAKQPHSEEKLEQRQHSAAFITGENSHRPLESMGRSDNVCIVDNSGEESHSDVRLTEHTEGPLNAPSSFTFGNVLAPLYPLVCGQVKSENRNLADQLKSLRELSRMGDSMENRMSTDLTENDEETSRISTDLFKSHERKSMNTHLNDVPIEDGKLCVSVAADTSTNPTDVDCQESEHECTGTPNNPQPITDEDMTPSEVNNEMLNACTTRAGLDHQGKAEKGPQALGCQWKNQYEKQIMEDAAKAQTEPEEVFSDIQMQLNPTQTLSQPKVLQETTQTASQPHLSPSVSACENQAMEQQICCEAATSFICPDESNKQDGVPPTVSTTHIYPEQGREREQLEELDPKCFMCPVRLEAADISVLDQSNPELGMEGGHGGSAVDLSQETLKTSLEDVEEPDDGGNESTNNLEEGDITPTVEHEDSVDVSECIQVNKTSCTHPDMLAKEIGLTLVEKPVCMQPEAEHCASEDEATKQDYLRPYEEKTEDKNWKMVVEEEEKDALGEEVRRKEFAENGEKENDELKEKQTITEQQPMEKTVGCEKHTETESDGQKCFNSTEEKSKIEVETVEEPLVWEEQEVEEKKVKKDADHDTDNQHDVWEEIRNKEKENLAETDRETRVEVEDKVERIPANEEVNGAGEGGTAMETVEESVDGTAKEERNKETERPEMGSDASQKKVESDPSTPVSNVHECEVERVIDKENSPNNETTCFPTEMQFISEEEVRSITYRLHLTSGQSKALSESARCGSDSWAAEKGSRVFTDEPECDLMAEEREVDSSSSESPSDEEMELYMHRLRAAPRPQSLRSFPRDGGSRTGKRLSIDRPKLLSSSMPPISESVNEEQLTRIPDTPEKKDVENFQADSGQFPRQDNQEYGGVNTAQWTSTFSCSNILKSLLYITMCVLFVVVGYHYDFLACFALYLLSILWLYCRADSQFETTVF